MTAWLVRPTAAVPYEQALHAMHALAERRARDEIPDLLVLVEHPPTYTCGRRTHPSHIAWARERIAAEGAEIYDVDRGGSVTFHGPGQLVGYPILDLGRRPDLVGYLRDLEETVIRACGDAGITVGRDPLQAGVWAGTAKVCAIGVHLTRWRITSHGFALNCDVDLSWFDAIVPCGLADRGVTSLSAIAGSPISTDDMAARIAGRFEGVFGRSLADAPTDIADLFGATHASLARVPAP